FQDLPVLGAGERLEGQATARALLSIGQVAILLDRGQVGVVAARVSGRTELLSARPLCPGFALGLAVGGMAFALGAEELLLAETELGAQRFVLGAKLGLAGDGQLVHAFPVGGLAVRLEAFGQMRADGARPLGQSRRGASRSTRQSDALRWLDD